MKTQKKWKWKWRSEFAFRILVIAAQTKLHVPASVTATPLLSLFKFDSYYVFLLSTTPKQSPKLPNTSQISLSLSLSPLFYFIYYRNIELEGFISFLIKIIIKKKKKNGIRSSLGSWVHRSQWWSSPSCI